jgi:hypothetical protein
MVRKKSLDEQGNPKWRLVVDYRKLNDISFPECFRLPLISECLNEVARQHPEYFTNFDLHSGFTNVLMEEGSKRATAFMVPGVGPGTGQFQFKRAPFGLNNLPFVFQKLLQKVFQGLPVIVYLDDILVMSPKIDDSISEENQNAGAEEPDNNNNKPGMLTLIKQCLQHLVQHKLKLNLEKCNWIEKSVVFLGHKISGKDYEPAEDKLLAISMAKPPKSVREVRQWNGLINFFRQSIPSYSMQAQPLTRLTRKDCSWPEDALKAFLEQKAFMLKKPILALPRDAPYHLYVDGSLGEVDDENSGGVVQEDTLGRKRALGCFSRSLRKHEKNYNAFLVEQLAITAALDHFHIYLLGREFTLFPDHKPFGKFVQKSEKNIQLATTKTSRIPVQPSTCKRKRKPK